MCGEQEMWAEASVEDEVTQTFQVVISLKIMGDPDEEKLTADEIKEAIELDLDMISIPADYQYAVEKVTDITEN